MAVRIWELVAEVLIDDRVSFCASISLRTLLTVLSRGVRSTIAVGVEVDVSIVARVAF